MTRLVRALDDRLEGASRRLRRRIARATERSSEPDLRRTQAALADALRARVRGVESAMAAWRSSEDIAHAHAVRIALKHLRYLLESLADGMPSAATAVRALARAQDCLGSLHDTEILVARLDRDGRREVALLARARRDLAGAADRARAWRDGPGVGSAMARIGRVISALDARAALSREAPG